MPTVEVDRTIDAPLDEVWHIVCDVASYPAYMTSVQAVTVDEEHEDGRRLSSWSVLLKGSALEWTESERVDGIAHRIDFEQTDGDLDVFRGFWQVMPTDQGPVAVVLRVDFEIGIPLLAEMLNPVAAEALTDNCDQMLSEIERRVAAV